MSASAERLRSIKTLPALIAYLRDELHWPIPTDAVETDLTFTYEPAELGLRDEDAVKVRKIHQLRPLDSGQPWGIFFIDFENRKLPVVVLRRILSHLVIRKRATASRAQRTAWHAEDLLFIKDRKDRTLTKDDIAP